MVQAEEGIRIKVGPSPAQHNRLGRPENDPPAPLQGPEPTAGAIPVAAQESNHFRAKTPVNAIWRSDVVQKKNCRKEGFTQGR